MSEQREAIARIIAPDQWRARAGDISHGEEWHRKADRYAVEADPNMFPLGQQAIDRTVEAWHGLADRFITGAGNRVKDSLAKADLILATAPTPPALLHGLREALARLELANDVVARATTRERYLTDLADVQPALLELDDARINARAVLATPATSS